MGFSEHYAIAGRITTSKGIEWEASYTLFAPADIAFAYLSPETIGQLLHAENQGNLADVLGYNADSAKYGRATDLLMVGFYRCAFGTWIKTEV